MLSTPAIDSAGSGGEPTLTAITTSTPQRSRSSRTGTLSTSPPSTSLRPRQVNGASSPGTAMLERMASVSGPSRITTRSPVPMSVAMMDSGSGSRSICGSPVSARTSALRKNLMRWPCTSAGGATALPSTMPVSLPGRKRWRSRRARRSSSPSPAPSMNISFQSAACMAARISAGLRPATQAPATSAPMLVPATQCTGTRRRSSSSSTPMCAAPRAPPPPSTRPMRGAASAARASGDRASRNAAAAVASLTA